MKTILAAALSTAFALLPAKAEAQMYFAPLGYVTLPFATVAPTYRPFQTMTPGYQQFRPVTPAYPQFQPATPSGVQLRTYSAYKTGQHTNAYLAHGPRRRCR